MTMSTPWSTRTRAYQNLGAGFAGGLDFARHAVAVYHRHLDAVARLDAVGAVCIIKESYLDSLDVPDERYALRALQRVGVSTHMVHSETVQGLDGGAGPLVATVQTVVVGRQEHVESGVLQGLCVIVGSGEAGIARIVGTAAQGYLQVAHRVIGGGDVGSYQRVAFVPVIAFAAAQLTRAVQLRLMLHGVAHKQQVGARRGSDAVRARDEREQTERQYS